MGVAHHEGMARRGERVERSSGAAPPRPSGSGDQDDQTVRDPLTIEVERLENVVSIVALSGELDLATIPRLEDRLFDELRASNGVILDLTLLSFIDSSGIGLLIKANRAADAGQLQTVLTRGSQVERVFNLAGIDRALQLFFKRDQAIAAREDGAGPSKPSTG